ncbi:ribosomal protein S18 acetylase RimI-like enzyme [Flavobacterium sp. 270]|uniref:GNAT family N-acetyltransferase n=1 Tax=Flavobacterium sp. 270 TaxID=2512114 RepID=UPI001065F4A4|nr:GNAT family N-acetyltransferase [Flavobacterium sp. 270]TDW51724.1 ribosomal protein S18 acetylase RimI-like enzyme [Flavobacterium sp. 270]
MEILNLKTSADIEFAREAILEFRTSVAPEQLIDQTLEMIDTDNFQLACIPSDDGKKAAGFVGFRTMNMLRTGKIIYIDDLFTLPEYRGRGYAGKLLDYVDQMAKENGINAVHLDSGFALHPAHRLYLSKGYVLACHHFAKTL